jgi:hypothetical protein
MQKSDIKIMPAYYERYVNLCDEVPVLEALVKNGPDLMLPFLSSLNAIGLKTYEPNKWTIHQILQHVIDTERIFSYRALRFARNDQTPLAGFDENTYSIESQASTRNLDELISEFEIVRRSNIALFKSFNDTQLIASGVANGNACSVLALGFMMAGHWLHHLKVIEERYLPLVEEQ